MGDSISIQRMRQVELWKRMHAHLGETYAHVWADQIVLAQLGGRTVSEALAAGVDCKTIWRAVWAALELDTRYR